MTRPRPKTQSQQPKVQKKRAEDIVGEFLQTRFPDISFVHNRTFSDSECACACRRRIDYRYLIGGTVLAIEVDERSHRGYSDFDEFARYNDTFMAFSGAWIWIRFNPDAFFCNGLSRMHVSLGERLKVLGNLVQKQLDRVSSGEPACDMVEIHKLFYDQMSIS